MNSNGTTLSDLKAAKVLRSARKGLGLSKRDVARELGLTVSYVSDLETAVAAPTATDWYHFCELTCISTDSLLVGQIERGGMATLDHDTYGLNFNIPQEYREARGSKVKAMAPFLEFAELHLGPKEFEKYLVSKAFDPDFFVDLDQQVNLRFCMDLSRLLIQQQYLTPESLDALTSLATRSRTQGKFHQLYSDARDDSSLLFEVLSGARGYECNFDYVIEAGDSRSFDFSVRPEAHLAQFNYRDDSTLGDFLCRYKKSYFEKFVGLSVRPTHAAQLEELECHYRGAPKCTYRLNRMAS